MTAEHIASVGSLDNLLVYVTKDNITHTRTVGALKWAAVSATVVWRYIHISRYSALSSLDTDEQIGEIFRILPNDTWRGWG